MKANELMIGDWVCHKDWPSFPIRVCGISTRASFEHSLLWNEDNREYVRIERYSEADYNEITPIPLTPEILEKNGFYLETYTGEWMSDYWWTRNDFVLHESMIDSVGRNNFKYNYVHELQHALKLCGIEKTIEL